MPLLRGDKPDHVALQKQRVGEPADHAQRRFPRQHIAHDGLSIVNFEFMNMTQGFERSARHFIHEPMRPFQLGDFCSEPLSQAEVASFEGDQIAKLEKAIHAPRLDKPLTAEGRALRVCADVASQIEASLDGSVDDRLDANRGQNFSLTPS